MRPDREYRLELALQLCLNILQGAEQDLDRMKRFHPSSKRGSNYTAALESLEMRLSAGVAEAERTLAQERADG